MNSYALTCKVSVCPVLFVLFSWIAPAHAIDPSHSDGVTNQTTANGQVFQSIGSSGVRPAPTLFLFANSAAGTLSNEYYIQCGAQLRRKGYLCVSLDLPCHGNDRHPREEEGLVGWQQRLDAGEDLVGDFSSSATDVLTYLIDSGQADPDRIAVCGTSRGAFMAMHWAARDKRVKCIVAIAPITKLDVVEEFHSMRHPGSADSASTHNLVDQLVGRNMWIVIGDCDERIDTDSTIAFARKISAAAAKRRIASCVDLHVLCDPRGHSVPASVAGLSAAWIVEQFASNDR